MSRFATQKQAKEVIQAAIDTNDRAAVKALMLIYNRQTDYEKNAEQTVEANGVGFGAFDAEILSSFAEQYQKRGFLTDKQMAICRKRVRSYWKQLYLMDKERTP